MSSAAGYGSGGVADVGDLPPISQGNQTPTTDERNDMSDNTTSSGLLTKATMLPVEGVIYCLDHTAVHDDTEDPYGTGESECSRKEHRSVYYRGRKGDYDERTGGDGERATARPIIAAGQNDALNDPERLLMLRLVGRSRDTAQEAVNALREIFGPEDSDVGEVDDLLTLLNSIHDKLTTTMLDDAVKEDR